MSNATLIVNEIFHQGDRRFSDASRGRQCAFTSLLALLLTEGDAMYLKTFQEQTIPDTETISLRYLPDGVRQSAIDIHDIPETISIIIIIKGRNVFYWWGWAGVF